MSLFVFLILFSLKEYIFCDDSDSKRNYEGYQVWSTNVKGTNLSRDLTEKLLGMDIWHVDDRNIDFLLNGNDTGYWKSFLESQNISHTVLIDDVQKAIEKEAALKTSGSRKVNWDSYAQLADIYAYLKSKADAHPKNCILRTIGKTNQNKEIKMLKVTNGKIGNGAVLIEAGMHGREWLGVSSLLYFVETITSNFNTQPGYIRHKDWYIIPVANPDGYEYSMNKDRLWRKNRRRLSGQCDGVDVSRNFDAFWGSKGASPDTCANNYFGLYVFSEKESIAIRDLVQENHFMIFVSIHGHGSTVLYPWLATGKKTKDLKAHVHVSKEVVKAMNGVHKMRNYKFNMNIKSIRGSGMAVDWAYQQGIQHSYLIESRSRYFQVLVHCLSTHAPTGQDTQLIAWICRCHTDIHYSGICNRRFYEKCDCQF